MQSLLMKITFGEWFKLMRERQGLSQADVANAIGVKTQTVSSWETGRSHPSLSFSQTQSLCDLFKVSLKTLASASKGELKVG